MTRLIDRLGCIQSLQQRWSGFFGARRLCKQPERK